VTLPADIAGDVVPAVIDVVKSNGSSVSSNITSIGIDTHHSEGSNPLY